MIGRNKSSFVVCAAALAIIAAAYSSITYAQIGSLLWGGQVCQTVQGSEGIVYRGGGAFNATEARQNVICPVAVDRKSASNLVDATVRVVNRSSSQREVECGIRISGPAGYAVQQEFISESLASGAVVVFLFANYTVVGPQTASVICDLASQTGVTSVGVELIE